MSVTVTAVHDFICFYLETFFLSSCLKHYHFFFAELYITWNVAEIYLGIDLNYSILYWNSQAYIYKGIYIVCIYERVVAFDGVWRLPMWCLFWCNLKYSRFTEKKRVMKKKNWLRVINEKCKFQFAFHK